ncbi:MAG: aldo/keto reductase [Hyphomicrobiales bacterium]|nr:aldo/keto reductase [Hyphomicrobiales bacterium]
MTVIEANGARIPAIGLGTMTLKEQVCIQTVKTALKLGYRHIDTAERYGNEESVGEGLHQGLAETGLKREDVFVTTKVYWDKLAPGDFETSVTDSLRKLRLPFVDLLLIHWNNPKVPLSDSIRSLCAAKAKGQTRHVGVANFTTTMLDEAVRLASEPLVTNQIELHPFLDQSQVIAACRRHGMAITAYCPIARGKVPGNETLERIGGTHGRSAAQVALRYLVQQGIIPIPRTATPAHLAANLAVFDFALTPSEMADIAALARPDGRVVNPAHAPHWD